MTFIASRTVCHCRINTINIFNFFKRYKLTNPILQHSISKLNRCCKDLKVGNFWYLSAYSSRNNNLIKPKSQTNCFCKNFHTKGDDQFLKFLNNQIQNEKENMIKVSPPLNGWSLEQTGTNCLLSKDYNYDRKSHCKINVTFNVNESISMADFDNADKTHVIARPDFAVEVNKVSSPHVITFNCYFLEDFFEKALSDRLHGYGIRSVIVHEGHVEESTYVIDVQCIDMNLYQHMLLYLEERGITEVFTDEIMRIATAVENQEFIMSLERLNSFVSCE